MHDFRSSQETREHIARLIADAVEGGEVDHYAGKRGTQRVTEPIQMEMTDALNKKPVPVSMHNISETGCAFWIKRQIDVHTQLYLREFTPDNSARWMRAWVTHCTQGIRGYLIGVAFSEKEY